MSGVQGGVVVKVLHGGNEDKVPQEVRVLQVPWDTAFKPVLYDFPWDATDPLAVGDSVQIVLARA